MSSFKNVLQFSTKQSLVDKDNNFILVMLATTSAIFIFCLVTSSSLYSMMKYQDKVIKNRNNAAGVLSSNFSVAQNLKAAYQEFENKSPIVVGPVSNSVMILDALPSKYDFPALVTSLSTQMDKDSIRIKAITGSDKQITAIQSSSNPTLTPIPFTISGEGAPGDIEKFILDLEKSIRPMIVSNVEIDASSSSLLTFNISATTYYQPEKTFGINYKTVDATGALK